MTAVNELQIQERRGLSPDELVVALDAAASLPGRRSRQRSAGRNSRSPLVWAALGYLNGPIYTRDTWMHRIDVCRATECEPVLTGEHDGRIVADLLGQWSSERNAPLEAAPHTRLVGLTMTSCPGI